jgi:amino acid adenylation domain-containing protein/thioester reductase-like protein
VGDPLETAVLRLARGALGAADLAAADPLAGRCDDGAATALAQTLAAVFGTDLDGPRIRGIGTVAGLVEHIRSGRTGPAAPALRPGLAAASPRGSEASPGQRGIWLIDQVTETPTAYNGPFWVRVPERLDVELLRRAVEHVVAGHEVLRTTYALRGDVLHQVVDPRPRVAFSTARCGADPRELVERVARTRLDLADGPVAEVVAGTGGDGTVVVVNIHHIASDAASAGLFLDQVLTAYEQLEADPDTAPAPRDGPQYADFAQWQREHLDGPVLDGLLDHWAEQLAGELPVLAMPADRPRPAVGSQEGDVVRFEVGPELLGRLTELGRREGVTPFMVCTAAYAALLHRHTGQERLLVGTPASLRDDPATADVIGYLVNLVVLQLRVGAATTVRELLRAVRDEVTRALAHKQAPFDRVVERVAPGRRGGGAPLVQTMAVLTPPGSAATTLHGRRLTIERNLGHGAKYDLSLVLETDERGLHGVLEYDSHLFDRSTAAAFAERLVSLFEQVAERPDATVGELRAVTAAEERRLAQRCDRAADVDGSVLEELAARAAERPGHVAVDTGSGPGTTYRELDVRSDAVAAALAAAGAGPGTRVGLLLPRGVDVVVALLGVLKAGASYVPLDPGHPRDRIERVLRGAGVGLVLATDPAGPTDGLPADVVTLPVAQPAAAAPPVRRGPSSETYVIHTSGSTGVPKGVVIEDRTITNLVRVQRRLSPPGAEDRTLQFMSPTFDVSVMEVLGTLCAGGTLVVPPDDVRADPAALARFAADRAVTRTYLPYVALQQLAAAVTAGDLRLPALREVVSVGEQLVVSPQIRALFAERTPARLRNMYGPSETHLATWHELTGDPAGWPDLPPIGVAVPGVSLEVLDAAGCPVPPGAVGELHIGGPLLSPGYDGLAEETARRFAPGPDGTPRYRTGDLVRSDADGVLTYLGRADDQVKIRGYRVEPAETEAALGGLDDVDAAAVAAVDVAPGDRRLVAFLVTRTADAADPVAVRRALSAQLPEHLVPTHVVRLERLPLSTSGKVDRSALPALFTPSGAGGAGAGGTGPDAPVDTELGRVVAREWAELLGVGETGIAADDDFFALGGHSIMATQLAQRLRARCEVEIPLRALLDDPTVAGMAARIEEHRDPGRTPRATTTPDLPADVVLPERVRARGPALRTAAATDVLLTGATGFLGVYLLRDLLRDTRATVHCLVRAEDEDAAWERVRATAEGYGIAGDLPRDRIRLVPGDLARPHLGLTPEAHDALAAAVGAVYHAAAHINFVVPYASVRPTNVVGFTRVLEFATAPDRPLPVHYASTIAVFAPGSGPGPITESDAPTRHEGLGIGYTQSKWVAERIAALARERGVPITVYRIGRISGDSTTGACQPDDFLWRQIKSFIQLGSAPPPADMATDLLPVDFVSTAITALSRDSATDGADLHLFHPEGADFGVVLDGIRRCGHPVEVLGADTWFDRLEESAAASADNALAAAVPLFREGALELGDNRYGNAATTAVLHRHGLDWPAIDAEAVARMIRFFRAADELPV